MLQVELVVVVLFCLSTSSEERRMKQAQSSKLGLLPTKIDGSLGLKGEQVLSLQPSQGKPIPDFSSGQTQPERCAHAIP